MTPRLPQTGPLTGTTQIATCDRMTDDEKNKRDALLLLDVTEDYCYSMAQQLAELKFNFGYTDSEALAVYNDWLKVH